MSARLLSWSEHNRERLLIILAVAAALTLIMYELARFEGFLAYSVIGLSNFTKNMVLVFFFASAFFLFRFQSHIPNHLSFLENIQKVFSNGLFVLLFLLILKTLVFLAGKEIGPNAIMIVLGVVLFVVVSLFLMHSYFVWKRLILYQRTKALQQLWQVFEFIFIGAIVFQLLDLHFYDNIFLLTFGLVFSYSIIVSFNLRWVAYLNLKQKGQSLLLMSCSLACALFFYTELVAYSDLRLYKTIDLSGNLFLLSSLAFFIVYAIVSILVIAFNLPTSSVFEQKFGDLLQYQRMNQIVELGQQEPEICEALLEGSHNSTAADASWMDIYGEHDAGVQQYVRGIEKTEIEEIKKLLFDPKRISDPEKLYFTQLPLRKIASSQVYRKFNSALIIPLRTSKSDLGMMVLLKEVPEGFEKEMIDLVKSYTISGAQSVQNSRLLNQEKEKERLQTQMEMAREVQQGLIPTSYVEHEFFSMAGQYQSAHEIGGDYFDQRTEGSELFFVIGDVAGKGASAALNMAQMRGVFQSLILTAPAPLDFIKHANEAMVHCLKGRSFITLLYLHADTINQKLQWVRAGHCPALHFNSITGKSTYLQSKGLGLGIIKSNDFVHHVDAPTMKYTEGDLLVLFTDGIVEARNHKQEEYGYEKIAHYVETHHSLPVRELCTGLLEDIRQFCLNQWDDDYALVVLRFN